MESTLGAISKEFGIQFSEKRKRHGVRGTVARTWKAATSVARRRTRARIHSSEGDQPQPSRWRLPLELMEQIIDHLYDDLPTLCSCALVCHALVASARQYLFYRILITGGNFVNAVVLLVKNPHLAGYIRDLYFEGGEGAAFETMQALLEGEEPSKLLRVFVLVIAPRLVNVVRLTVMAVRFD